MMAVISIYESDLDFIKEAKIFFDDNFSQESFIDQERQLIALRRGPDRDCIQVFRLDSEVCFVHNIMQPAPGKLFKKSEGWLHL